MVGHKLSLSGKVNRLAVVIILLAVAGASLVASRADDDDQISPQALVNINLSPDGAAADVQVVGALAGDHLSGSGTQGVFTDLKRSRALAVGDFNADNIQDIVIGSPDADPGVIPARPEAGAVYIIFGRTTAFLPVFDTGTNNPNIRILGAAAGDNLGFAVATGDVNGDTFDDVVIGAPGVDFPGIAATPSRATPIPNTGAVYVFLGSATQTNRTIDLATANAADVLIYGISEGDLFGNAVAIGNAGGPAAAPGAEQLIRDILVGAPGNEGPAAPPRPDGGAAFLLFGRPTLAKVEGVTLVIDIGNTATPANVQIFGDEADLLGNVVAIADLNNTAPGDLIVGAPVADRPELPTFVPAADNTGAVYIYFGGANLLPAAGASKTFDINAVAANQRPSVLIYGRDADDHMGASIAVGDVSGDGVQDLLIGAPDGDGPPTGARTNAGEAYLLNGTVDLTPPSAQVERRVDIFQAGAFLRLTVFGEAAGDHAGASVATGNFNVTGNIDSIPELIIGSPGALTNRGSVSVLFGGSSLTIFAAVDLALGQDSVRVTGQAVNDELGWALATADLDQNRGGDLILGAPFADPVVVAAPRAEAGKVYFILAENDVVPPPNLPPTVQVTSPNGAEVLQGGAVFDITWTAADPNGDATIQRFEVRLSTDGGGTFNTIIDDDVAGTARTLPWTVPRINSTTARIRVIAVDNGGIQAQDDSDANFTINDPGVPVHLIAPNGGQNLKFGQTFQIAWEVPVGTETQVLGFDIFLSTNSGATFNIAIQDDPVMPKLPAGARTFDWLVPNTICTQTARVLVRATSVIGSRSLDSSDADFSITGPGPTLDLTDMSIEDQLKLITIQPAVGDEIRFADNVVLELSNDAAGTQFFQFNKLKKKKNNRRLISKGSINGQSLEAFFPVGATRLMRITNPPCGVTFLRVMRVGDTLVVVNP
jgi:hypothetical protein